MGNRDGHRCRICRRDLKPGITGLAQISLGYQGDVPEGSEIAPFAQDWRNPFELDELDDDSQSAVADDMRMKLLYDLAYAASLESSRAMSSWS